MNRDLFEYIYSLPEPLSLRLWLYALKLVARNGTSNVFYNKMSVANRCSEKDIHKYFKPLEAEALGIITVLHGTPNFVSINFRKGNKLTAGPTQFRLAAKADPLKALQQDNQENAQQDNQGEAQTLTPAAAEKNTPAVKGLLTELPVKNYQPSHALVKEMIGDYILFFKQLQIDKAAFIGHGIGIDQAAAPKIEGEDVKHLKELAKHFAGLSGIGNEDQIRRCFHRIYGNWWNFTDFIKNKPELRFIRSNINTIIIEIQALNNNNGKTADKRENELNSKINRARSKDYSKLVKARKKDN